MGFLSKVGGALKGVARIATKVIPGGIDDMIVEGVIGAIEKKPRLVPATEVSIGTPPISSGPAPRGRAALPGPPPMVSTSRAGVGKPANAAGPKMVKASAAGGVAGIVGGAIAGSLADRYLPAIGNFLAPGQPFGGPVPAPQQQYGEQPGFMDDLARFGQRIIPGGRTGREWMAIAAMGGAIAVHPAQVARNSCPPGYVLVNDPTSGAPMCMLKGAARSLGLWRPRRKPPISAGDWTRIKVAKRVTKKAGKIAREAGWKVATKGSGRGCAPKRKCK